ncbi:hypothetical protein V2G26_010209 [Clonostachys chloroleuca]|uniref:Rhodopsin domain-containing protein n=1 Tax=Clonostachys chloroleuca TaxID=1926264 RepID=A0AA35M707_9HYPO|nr:unnamed protein product [Clonostachys chloroleuca]
MAFSPDQVHLLPLEQQEAFFNGPALAPPEGIIPNLEHPPNQNALTHAVTTLLFILSTGFAALHAFTCIARKKQAKWTDYVALLAYLFFVGYIIVTYWLIVTQGYFVHQWDMSVRTFLDLLLIVHIASHFYSIVMAAMKTVILVEWIQIFVPRGTRNGFVYTSWMAIAVNLTFYIIAIILLNVSARPYRRNFNFTVPGVTHFNSSTTIVAGAAINVVLDLVILVIPQRIIWRLKMKKAKKIGVSLIFLIGILGCIAGICRLAYSIVFFKSSDVSYAIPPMSLWCIAEMTCAIIIYCAPSVPRALKWNQKGGTTPSKASANNQGYSWSNPEASSTPGTGRKYTRIDEIGVHLGDISSQTRLGQGP